ncbi:sialin-like [Sitodiplosis mosellana]|uniref:sialin-like n=1 Tax=Sitodiplosis mosellana TaxID=263140 RepID=UPI002444EB47|nr:sialin-like [Sitodiplosis mosellana]
MVVPITINNNSAVVCPLKLELEQVSLDYYQNDNYLIKFSSKHGTRYNWTQTQQGFLLSSFFIGYFVTHIPGGILADKFGGKWTLSLGVLATAIFTLLTPVTAHYGGYAPLLTLRIFIGFGLGTSFPAINVLLACWIPQKERSEIGSFVFGGSMIGIALSYLLTGLILDYLIWDWVFYIWGIVALVWFGFFTFFCYNDPASDPFLSKKEHDYLESQIGRLKRSSDLPPTPWKDIFKSIPMLALICIQIGHDWSAATIITNLPKYMSNVLGFPVFEVGLFSALPYIVMWIVSVASGFLSDYLIQHDIISITFTRKLFSCGTIFTAIFILIASYSGCNRNMAVAFFVVAMGFMGIHFPHIKINPLDLSQNYAVNLD